MLLHVIDVSGSENRKPVDDFKIINEELKKYSEKLSLRKQIIVANKVDAMQDETLYNDLEELAKKQDIKIFKISAATGEGLKELFNYVSEILKALPKEDIVEGEERVVYTLKEDKDQFEIYKDKGEFIVLGPAVDRLMSRVNLEDNESLYYFQKTLKNLGIEQALKDAGVTEGDTVRFNDWEFAWYE